MRRIHVQEVAVGNIRLELPQAHHARNVLRLSAGAQVEVFDDAGRAAAATIIDCQPSQVIVHVDRIQPPAAAPLQWIIASAVPKGPRADWMVEKLSELGTAAFIPLVSERCIVTPEGKSKRDRWLRLSAEAARQSRRRGVMRIEELTDLPHLLQGLPGRAWYFSTAPQAISLLQASRNLAAGPANHPQTLTLLVGPEGGWSEAEIARFDNAGLTPVSLGTTILRIETAAVAAAALAAAIIAPSLEAGAT